MSISSLAAVQVHASSQPPKSQQPRVPEKAAQTAFSAAEKNQASSAAETRRSVNILV